MYWWSTELIERDLPVVAADVFRILLALQSKNANPRAQARENRQVNMAVSKTDAADNLLSQETVQSLL